MVIKGYNRFFSILLILLLVAYTLIAFCGAAFAVKSYTTQDATSIEAKATVDKKEATIGEKIKLTICVNYKAGLVVEFPELDQQIGVFAVKRVEGGDSPRPELHGCFSVERSWILRTYEVGRQTVPPLKIKYKGRSGEETVATNEVTVEVKGLLKEGEEASEIKDISPPLDVPTNFKRLLIWLWAGFVALLIFGAVFWLMWKRKGAQKTPEMKLPPRAPHEVAYELLDTLTKDGLIAKGLVKEYYYRLTDIVRHYIEGRFGLLAPERTTEEFLAEMAHANTLDKSHKVLIQEFLNHCDMVKYAKYGPSLLEIEETYLVARRLIDETKDTGNCG